MPSMGSGVAVTSVGSRQSVDVGSCLTILDSMTRPNSVAAYELLFVQRV